MSKQVVAIVQKVRQDLRKQRVIDSCQLKHHHILLLKTLKFGDDMAKKFLDFSVDYDIGKHQVLFKGYPSDIMESKVEIFEILNKISKQMLESFHNIESSF